MQPLDKIALKRCRITAKRSRHDLVTSHDYLWLFCQMRKALIRALCKWQYSPSLNWSKAGSWSKEQGNSQRVEKFPVKIHTGKWYKEIAMRVITVTTTVKQLPQNNDIIGWKKGNNRAAQAALILVHFFDALYKTTSSVEWRFWQQRGNTTEKDFTFLAWIQNHSCSSRIFRT